MKLVDFASIRKKTVLVVAVAIPLLSAIVGAESESIAKKGSLKLSLKVATTKVRKDQPIWFQVRLANIGTKVIAVADDTLCRDGFAMGLERNTLASSGLRMTLRRSDGRLVSGYFPHTMDGCPRDNQLEKPASSNDQARINEWRRQGLTIAQIQKRLDAERDRQIESMDLSMACGIEQLKPGQVASTPTWSAKNLCSDRAPKWAPPAGYAELFQYTGQLEPGSYNLRVIFSSNRIRLQTPAIGIEVLP